MPKSKPASLTRSLLDHATALEAARQYITERLDQTPLKSAGFDEDMYHLTKITRAVNDLRSIAAQHDPKPIPRSE